MKKMTNQISKLGKILLIISILFSQFSFPLQVLADQLLEQEVKDIQELKENEYKIEMNGKEVEEEYTIEEEYTTITINQSYTGEESDGIKYTCNDESIDQTKSLDFSNKLYGDYTYTFKVLSKNDQILAQKTITIHYQGDNRKYLIPIEDSKITYQDGYYIVLGKTITSLTKQDILSNFKQDEITSHYAKLDIYNKKTEVATEEESILNDYQLGLKNNETEEITFYPIAVVGDYNQDGIVNKSDAESMIDGILNHETTNFTNDVNQDSKFNILDATYPVFTTGEWENQTPANNTLQAKLFIKNQEEIYVNQEFQLKFYLTGFSQDELQDKLTGISGKINYDKTTLELTNLEINENYSSCGDKNTDGEFAYLLNDYDKADILMTLTFKPLASGNIKISIDNIIASLGVEAKLQNDTVATEVTVLDYGKGGDVETPATVPAPMSEKTPETPAPIVQTSTKYIPYKTALSSDNYIKSLIIKGYKLNFDKNKYQYSLKVKNNVKSLDLEILLNDENANYTVDGNNNFKEGENIVTITVTAENGDTKVYTLKVNREKNSKSDNQEETQKSSKTIIIILIILVIIGLIYVIFKDDEEDKKEIKKDNKKESKK